MQPDPGPDGFWSSCDDEQPGVSIRPLGQADLAALLAHLDHDEGQEQKDFLGSGGPAPVLAVRVRASVGRPGASAQGEYQRRRATELATWVRSLPWRIVALVAAGVATWLAAAPVAPNLAAPTGVTGHRSLAARGDRRATHRPPLGCSGAAGVGGPA